MEKIKEIRGSNMVTISCGTCKEGLNSIAKFMLESDTNSTEVYPDAFKEIKKVQRRGKFEPLQIPKKTGKIPQNHKIPKPHKRSRGRGGRKLKQQPRGNNSGLRHHKRTHNTTKRDEIGDEKQPKA